MKYVMKKFLIALVLAFALIFPLSVNAQPIGDKPILSVREGCPHCAKVKAFLDKNNLTSTLEIKETFNNEANSKEMESWFTKLHVTDPNQNGVPFLILDDKTYLVGDVPIIEYLAEKHNITIDITEYESSPADTIFLAVGGLLLFGVLGYGVYSSLKKKN